MQGNQQNLKWRGHVRQSQFWRFLPASIAHRLAPIGISYYASKEGLADCEWKPFSWNGIHFKNRLGIAGGVDKNAEKLTEWQKLGAGFLEVGTVTPYSQGPNSGKIIDRDWNQSLLWNKMGFPNKGSDEVYFNIRNFLDEKKIPLFVNIGKNRTRANEEAHLDYNYLADRFKEVSDILVINVSSPNTTGLRSLQSSDQIRSLVDGVKKTSNNKNVLVKLSPDMDVENLCETISSCAEGGANGFILTNTTLSRPPENKFPSEGGVSGKLLKELSVKALKTAISTLGSQRSHFLIVSAGGILNTDDVKQRLDLGADLLQVYAALVFSGPLFFQSVSQEIQ